MLDRGRSTRGARLRRRAGGPFGHLDQSVEGVGVALLALALPAGLVEVAVDDGTERGADLGAVGHGTGGMEVPGSLGVDVLAQRAATVDAPFGRGDVGFAGLDPAALISQFGEARASRSL